MSASSSPCGLRESALIKISFPENPNFGTTQLVVHEISGATDSFSTPDECSFMLSALTTPPVKYQDVIDEINKLAISLSIDAFVEPLARKTPYGESYEVAELNRFLKSIESKIFKSAKVSPVFTDSIADENVFANRLGIPIISMGPIGGNDHTANEWINTASIGEVAKGYRQILRIYNKA